MTKMRHQFNIKGKNHITMLFLFSANIKTLIFSCSKHNSVSYANMHALLFVARNKS